MSLAVLPGCNPGEGHHVFPQAWERLCGVRRRSGAEDGSEMGALNFLKQPQRVDNLRASLNEFLRFGLEAGIFFVT